MPTPTYESTGLPLPSGVDRGFQAAVGRTSMDAGLPRQVSRFNTGVNQFQVQWAFDGDQMQNFETFFVTTLENGTLFFTVQVPTSTGFEEKTVRFVGGEYSARYEPHDRHNVTALWEEQITQAVADPLYSPTPVWYRPEQNLISDLTVTPETTNKLYKANPGTGNSYDITVPEILDASDQMIVAVQMTGPGIVKIVTEGEVDEGGGGDPPTLLEYLASLSPWGLFDASAVVETSGSITELTDLSGNANHLTDSQTGTSRSTLDTGEILCTTVRAFVGDFPGSTVMPADFHAFAIVRMKTAGANANSSPLFGPSTAATTNYCWMYHTDASGNFTGVGGFGTSPRLDFTPVLPLGDYILCEFIYDSGMPAQDMWVNGLGQFRNFGTYVHANFTWTGLRLGSYPGNTTGRQPLAFTNVCIFDTTGGPMTRDMRRAIYDAYALEYPDIEVIPRRTV